MNEISMFSEIANAFSNITAYSPTQSITGNASSAMLALLGGTAFKLVFSFITELILNWQSHSLELARTNVQHQIEKETADRHERMLRLQKELNIEIVNVEIPKSATEIDNDNLKNIFDSITKPTGFKKVDAWNSVIRPGLASICILIWLGSIIKNGFVLSPWDLDLIGATLGIFIGSRITHTGR